MKKYSFLSILMVFVLCLTMVLAGCGDGAKDDQKATEPEEELTLELAVNNTVDALTDTDCSIPVLEDLGEKKVATIAVENLFTNVLNMDLSEMAFYDELSVTVEGQTLDLNLYCDGKDLAVSAPALLGTDQALGVNFSTFMDDLETSGLLDAMEAETGMTSEMLQEAISKYMDALEGMDTTESIEEGAKKLKKALKGVEETVEEDTVEVNGKKVDAVVFTYVMDKEDYMDLLDVMLEISEDNYNQTMDAMTEAGLANPDAMELENPYETIRQEIESEFESLELECTVRIAVNPENRCIMLVEGTMEGSQDDTKANGTWDLVLGVDPAKSDEYTMSLDFDADGSELTAEIAIVNTTDGALDTTTVTFDAEADGEKAALDFIATYDNDSNEYELTLKVDDEKYAVRGLMENTDAKFTITVDEVEGEGETLPLGLTISLENDPDCEIPAVPTYTNILTEMDLVGTLGIGGTEGYEDYEDYENWEDYEDWEASEDYGA